MSKSPSLATTASTSPTPTGFLDLSAEMRNKIYDLALVSDEPITVYLRKTKYGRWEWATTVKCNTGLLITCKTVHNEATPVFYGNNIISIMVKDIPLAISTMPINKMRFLQLSDLVHFSIGEFHTALKALGSSSLCKDIQEISLPDQVLHATYWPALMASHLLPLMRILRNSRKTHEEVANIVNFHLEKDNAYYSMQLAKEYTTQVRLEIQKLLAAEEKSLAKPSPVKQVMIDLTLED